MIPTSIDGTDITGATIDGTDVTEITVDGDTVFTAQQLPVAYSNLVAWYPFDSGEYGGSNADDVTAILGGSGDDTAYDGTVVGATYQSSGGVTDINAGANSGGFSFSDDRFDILHSIFSNGDPFSITAFVDVTSHEQYGRIWSVNNGTPEHRLASQWDGDGRLQLQFDGTDIKASGNIVGDGYTLVSVTYDGNTVTFYQDTTKIGDASGKTSGFSNRIRFMNNTLGGGIEGVNGNLDDVRVYNKELSASEVSDIFNNTKP